jgi:hypothetical protein
MNIINIASLLLEFSVVIIGLLLVIRKRRSYGWLIALTFAIYVFYDLVRFFGVELNAILLSTLFLVASVSIVWAMLRIYKGLE